MAANCPVSGYGGRLGLGQETVADTPVNATTYYEFTSEDMVANPNIVDATGVTGLRSHHLNSAFLATLPGGGSFSPIARYTSFLELLEWAKGEADGTLKSLTAHIDKVGRGLRVSGCKVNELEVSSSANAHVEVNCSLVGRTPNLMTGGYLAANYPTMTEGILAHKHAAVTIGGGIGVLPVYELGFTIQNGLNEDEFTSSMYRNCVPEGDRSVPVTLTGPFNSDTDGFLDLMVAGTPASVTIVYTDKDANVITITMGNVLFTGNMPTIEDRGRVQFTIEGMAKSNNTTEGSEIVIS